MRNIYIFWVYPLSKVATILGQLSLYMCSPPLSCYKNLFHLPNHKFTRTAAVCICIRKYSQQITSLHLSSPHFTTLHHTSPHISPFFWHHYNTLCFRLEMISIYDFLISYLVVSFMAGQTFSLYLSLDLPISIFILLSTVIALSQLSFSYK